MPPKQEQSFLDVFIDDEWGKANQGKSKSLREIQTDNGMKYDVGVNQFTYIFLRGMVNNFKLKLPDEMKEDLPGRIKQLKNVLIDNGITQENITDFQPQFTQSLIEEVKQQKVRVPDFTTNADMQSMEGDDQIEDVQGDIEEVEEKPLYEKDNKQSIASYIANRIHDYYSHLEEGVTDERKKSTHELVKKTPESNAFRLKAR